MSDQILGLRTHNAKPYTHQRAVPVRSKTSITRYKFLEQLGGPMVSQFAVPLIYLLYRRDILPECPNGGRERRVEEGGVSGDEMAQLRTCSG